MGGTREGGMAAKAKNLASNPNFYRDLGRLGGQARVPKGFALMTPEQRIAAGKKGGTKSRRTKKENTWDSKANSASTDSATNLATKPQSTDSSRQSSESTSATSPSRAKRFNRFKFNEFRINR